MESILNKQAYRVWGCEFEDDEEDEEDDIQYSQEVRRENQVQEPKRVRFNCPFKGCEKTFLT